MRRTSEVFADDFVSDLRREAEARPLRICHLGKFYPPARGGIETHVGLLASAQAKAGMKVQAICVNHTDRSGRTVNDRRLAVTETVESTEGGVRVLRLGRRASIAKLDVCPDLPAALGALERDPVDVLHLHVPNPTMLLALALRRTAARLVITYHSDVVRQKLLAAAISPVQRLVFQRAARIISNSPVYAGGSDVLQEFAAKTRTLPMGIEQAAFRAPNAAARRHAEALRAAHGRPLWLAVGRLVYYKGLHDSVAALRSVPGTLLIVGEEPLERDLRRQAAEIGVADRVIFRGQVSADELVGCYHAATALLFPSNARSEAFGLVQLEAMASGCPVINTAIAHSGVPWVSPHGVSGLTVPVGDVAALAAAARRLADDALFRQRLSLGAQARAEEFDHRRMVERSIDLYRETLRRPAARERAR